MGPQNFLYLLLPFWLPMECKNLRREKMIQNRVKKKRCLSRIHWLGTCSSLLPAGKNHIVHMDNWFSSIPLFNELASMLIWCCGTVRVNRKGLCKDITMKKKEESVLKKNPGTIRWASYGSLCYIAWFAKRTVHMLTNCYSPVSL